MFRKKCPEKRLPPVASPPSAGGYERKNSAPSPSGSLKPPILADKRKSANADDTNHNLTDQMKKLNPAQLRAFREVFENFDLEKSGTLTANELHQCINQLAGYQALTFEDVMAILEELDVKGTGDIEFDEFIFFMTRPQNLEKMLSDEDKKEIEEQTGVRMTHDNDHNGAGHHDNTHHDKPGDILFNILQRVLEQDNNAEIRNFYRQQILNKMDDNVIHDWSDGKRCIGLSDREIIQRYKEIAHKYRKDQSFQKHLGSPYAKPNKWGIAELRRDIEKRQEKRSSETATKDKKVLPLKRVKVREMEITVEAVPLPVYRVKKQGVKFTYDDVKQIRENVATLKKKYYRYLQDVAANNEHAFHEGLGIDKIRNRRNRQAANYAFETYCNPFVISPWVPKPNPTGWRTLISAPVGKATVHKGRFAHNKIL